MCLRACESELRAKRFFCQQQKANVTGFINKSTQIYSHQLNSHKSAQSQGEKEPFHRIENVKNCRVFFSLFVSLFIVARQPKNSYLSLVRFCCQVTDSYVFLHDCLRLKRTGWSKRNMHIGTRTSMLLSHPLQSSLYQHIPFSELFSAVLPHCSPT